MLPTFHVVPRHPHAWAWLALASQLAVLLLWIASGWKVGVPALLLTGIALIMAAIKERFTTRPSGGNAVLAGNAESAGSGNGGCILPDGFRKVLGAVLGVTVAILLLKRLWLT